MAYLRGNTGIASQMLQPPEAHTSSHDFCCKPGIVRSMWALADRLAIAHFLRETPPSLLSKKLGWGFLSWRNLLAHHGMGWLSLSCHKRNCCRVFLTDPLPDVVDQLHKAAPA